MTRKAKTQLPWDVPFSVLTPALKIAGIRTLNISSALSGEIKSERFTFCQHFWEICWKGPNFVGFYREKLRTRYSNTHRLGRGKCEMACPQFNKIFQSNETDQLQIKSHGKCFRESLFESNVPIFLLRIGRLSSWFMETWVVLTERPVFNGWYRRPSLDITRPFYMLGISRMTFKLMGDWWVCFNLSLMKDLFPWEQSVSDSVTVLH